MPQRRLRALRKRVRREAAERRKKARSGRNRLWYTWVVEWHDKEVGLWRIRSTHDTRREARWRCNSERSYYDGKIKCRLRGDGECRVRKYVLVDAVEEFSI